jgi:signal transduction histidine kinase
MRSLSSRILVACFCTLFVSSVAFYALFAILNGSSRSSSRNGLASLVLQQGVRAYEEGGPKRLEIYLAGTDSAINGDLHIVDMRGIDLVTGQDRADLLKDGTDILGLPTVAGGRVGMRIVSPDKHFQLVGITYTQRSNPWLYIIPYYFIIAAATALACWLLAVGIVVLPVKSLASTVEQFGAGNLSVRAKSGRKDEIGDLARTFNAMARRIANLLDAERRLLQDISHELRSPLARLNFAVELVRTSQDRDSATTRIKKDVDRLTELVDDLLKVVRPEGFPMADQTEKVSLSEVCSELVSDSVVEAQMRGCEIRMGRWDSGNVCGDRELLRRAIENVLRNAIRYAPSKTEVEINVEENLSEVIVTVRDYGPGVPEEALAHIFEPFYRADKAREKSTGGIGLGLAIAQRSVQTHSGSLTAENADPGLRVRISIPLNITLPLSSEAPLTAAL